MINKNDFNSISLSQIGLDSLQRHELQDGLEKGLQITLESACFFEEINIQELCTKLYSEHKKKRSNNSSCVATQVNQIDSFNTWIQEIKNELITRGYNFFSKTDTEVVLNAYKEWGVNSFQMFNGMWCFAILDKEKELL